MSEKQTKLELMLNKIEELTEAYNELRDSPDEL